MDLLTFGTVLSILIFAAIVRKSFSIRGYPTPPGPPQNFISGNMQQISSSQLPWMKFAKLSEIYGPLLFLKLSKRPTLVLNSAQACCDLLESRSSIYSDRPFTWMSSELAGRKHSVFSVSFHSPRFKTYRKLLRSGLSPQAITQYRDIQEQEVGILLQNLAEAPEKFITHIRRNTGAIVLKLAYGYSALEEHDPFVEMIEGALKVQADLKKPGRWLVEMFPIMRFIPDWFPGAYFKVFAKESKATLDKVKDLPFNWAKNQIENGDYIESFSSRHLKPETGISLNAEEEDIIGWCSAALYVGGADTTASALTTFFLAMTLYPEVQKRAQAEVDNIVGRDRLPNLDDKDQLLYVAAVIKEVLRWAPVAPLGLPHCVTQEDVYEKYLIPAGTTVFANVWAMTHDSNIYPNPHIFDPNRHLGVNPQPDPRRFVFGFGRRACPGAHFAEYSLFLNISNILSTFGIEKAIDKNGQRIDPEFSYTGGVTSHPEPFPCLIKQRSPGAFERSKS